MSAVCSGRSLCLHKFIKFQKQNNMVWKSANKDLDRNVIRFVPVLPQTENLMVNLSKGTKQTVTLSSSTKYKETTVDNRKSIYKDVERPETAVSMLLLDIWSCCSSCCSNFRDKDLPVPSYLQKKKAIEISS